MNLYLEKVSEFLKLEIWTDIFNIEFKGINFFFIAQMKKYSALPSELWKLFH